MNKAKKTTILRQKRPSQIGQAMVEFALVFVILFMLIFGIIEAGRLMLTWVSVYSASREATRWGASTDDSTGTPRYNDCAGIEQRARSVAFFAAITSVQVAYDAGPDDTPHRDFDAKIQCVQGVSTVSLGDRVVVQVQAVYNPIVPIVPIPPITVTNTDAHTVIHNLDILSQAGGSPTPGHTHTPTLTPTATDTDTAILTSTFTDTPTSTLIPALTHTPTHTLSPTPTFTSTLSPIPTSTDTPAPTSTPKPFTCASDLKLMNFNQPKGSTTFTIDLQNNNPTYSATIRSVTITWDAGANKNPVRFVYDGSTLMWAGSNATGNFTIDSSNWAPGVYSLPAQQTHTFQFQFTDKKITPAGVTIRYSDSTCVTSFTQP